MRKIRLSDAGLYTLNISNSKGTNSSEVEFIPELDQRKKSFASIYDCNNNIDGSFEANGSKNDRKTAESSDNENGFVSSIVSSVKQLFSDSRTGSRNNSSSNTSCEVTSDATKYKVTPMALVVGGVALLSGLYFAMRVMFPIQTQVCGSFPHELASNVQDWMFKCTASPSPSSPSSSR